MTTAGPLNPENLFSVKGVVALITGGGTGRTTTTTPPPTPSNAEIEN